MKKKKILIIGKTSFIGSTLFKYLKDKYIVSIKRYNNKNLKNINNYDYIINCSTNKNYVKKKYSKKNDIDLNIVNQIKNYKSIYIFLSSIYIILGIPNVGHDIDQFHCYVGHWKE